MATPTVRKRQLGNELRRLREASGHTPAEAADVLDCNITKITRLELGQSGIAKGDLKLLLEFYGDEPEHIDWMIELSRGNTERGRWTGHRAAVPEWFRVYVDLERDAADLRQTEVEIVPGLLQTGAYARALFEQALPFGGPADVDGAVQSRLERQQILERPEPPMLSFILSESCIRRMVGGRAVMTEQLRHLADLAGRPRVQLQLRPFDDEAPSGVVAHRFTIVRIPAPGDGQPLSFVYCEDFDDARYVDDPHTVRAYEALWGTMQAAALSPTATRRTLRELAAQLTGGPEDVPR